MPNIVLEFNSFDVLCAPDHKATIAAVNRNQLVTVRKCPICLEPITPALTVKLLVGSTGGKG